MTLPEAAHYIREFVPMSRVLSLYGYTLSRAGFMRCPFHSGDKNASLKVYESSSPSSRKKGWYCFGCHAGGSAIDFVMRHESCDFSTAVRAIDHHLSLGLLTVEPWDVQESCRNRQRPLEEAEQLLLQLADLKKARLLREYDETWRLWHDLDLIPGLQRSADDWARWQNYQEGLYLLEYKLENLESFRREVKSWRSRHLLRRLPRPRSQTQLHPQPQTRPQTQLLPQTQIPPRHPPAPPFL